jgi:uncharacterized membrane protein
MTSRLDRMLSRQVKIEGQNAIAAVLRYGSVISTLVMAAGVALAFARGTGLAGAASLHTRELLIKAFEFDPIGITQLGLLLLLLTPVFRVVAAIAAFGIERDFKYVLISSGVLLIVLGSIAFAMR